MSHYRDTYLILQRYDKLCTGHYYKGYESYQLDAVHDAVRILTKYKKRKPDNDSIYKGVNGISQLDYSAKKSRHFWALSLQSLVKPSDGYLCL